MSLTRTAMSFTAAINLLIQNGTARILEDPRLTTISGRTASLRAGTTLNVLTTTGGGTGTVATTQVQSFQTGVTLDITPVVNAGDYITVTLHPSVNAIAPGGSTVPNIQTRDTTTTVGLHDGETIVIGGLIEDVDQRTVQKIPLLSDIPLIGPALFTYHNISKTRNELVVTVTPHIVRPGENGQIGTSKLGIPGPGPLPTLPPGTQLPPPRTHPLGEGSASPIRRPASAEEPTPVEVPTPPLAPTPGSNTPPPGGVSPTPTPGSRSALPQPSANVSTPAPFPTAFSQTNIYTFGQAPQNNYAAPNAAPQIFYVQVAPSVVRNGQPMAVSAITSTNVTKLTFGPNAVVPLATLQDIGPGQWQAQFNFSPAGLPMGQGNINLTLTATTGLGSTVSVPIPLSLISP